MPHCGPRQGRAARAGRSPLPLTATNRNTLTHALQGEGLPCSACKTRCRVAVVVDVGEPPAGADGKAGTRCGKGAAQRDPAPRDGLGGPGDRASHWRVSA